MHDGHDEKSKGIVVVITSYGTLVSEFSKTKGDELTSPVFDSGYPRLVMCCHHLTVAMHAGVQLSGSVSAPQSDFCIPDPETLTQVSFWMKRIAASLVKARRPKRCMRFVHDDDGP